MKMIEMYVRVFAVMFSSLSVADPNSYPFVLPSGNVVILRSLNSNDGKRYELLYQKQNHESLIVWAGKDSSRLHLDGRIEAAFESEDKLTVLLWPIYAFMIRGTMSSGVWTSRAGFVVQPWDANHERLTLRDHYTIELARDTGAKQILIVDDNFKATCNGVRRSVSPFRSDTGIIGVPVDFDLNLFFDGKIDPPRYELGMGWVKSGETPATHNSPIPAGEILPRSSPIPGPSPAKISETHESRTMAHRQAPNANSAERVRLFWPIWLIIAAGVLLGFAILRYVRGK